MAGGDYDGDIAMISFGFQFVKLVKLVTESVSNLRLAEMKLSLVNQLLESAPEFFQYAGAPMRCNEYLSFAAGVCTVNLRGQVSAAAERVILKAIGAPADLSQLDTALQMCLCAHLATVVLKHFTHSQVATLSVKLYSESLKVKKLNKLRSSIFFQRGLKLPKVLKKDVLELANQKLS